MDLDIGSRHPCGRRHEDMVGLIKGMEILEAFEAIKNKVFGGGSRVRLIDADSFKNLVTAISLANGYDLGFVNEFYKLIDSCPTAYDVDKVVERLKVNSMYMEDEIDAFVTLDDAIEIVLNK